VHAPNKISEAHWSLSRFVIVLTLCWIYIMRQRFSQERLGKISKIQKILKLCLQIEQFIRNTKLFSVGVKFGSQKVKSSFEKNQFLFLSKWISSKLWEIEKMFWIKIKWIHLCMISFSDISFLRNNYDCETICFSKRINSLRGRVGKRSRERKLDFNKWTLIY